MSVPGNMSGAWFWYVLFFYVYGKSTFYSFPCHRSHISMAEPRDYKEAVDTTYPKIKSQFPPYGLSLWQKKYIYIKKMLCAVFTFLGKSSY